MWLPNSERLMMCLAISIQQWCVTDRQTDILWWHSLYLCRASCGKNITITDALSESESPIYTSRYLVLQQNLNTADKYVVNVTCTFPSTMTSKYAVEPVNQYNQQISSCTAQHSSPSQSQTATSQRLNSCEKTMTCRSLATMRYHDCHSAVSSSSFIPCPSWNYKHLIQHPVLPWMAY